MGEDGTDIGTKKLKALRDNSNFVRRCVRARAAAIFSAPHPPRLFADPSNPPHYSSPLAGRHAA
ncbi:unnamed protein product, partial [Scytosiphon promiscuus]